MDCSLLLLQTRRHELLIEISLMKMWASKPGLHLAELIRLLLVAQSHICLLALILGWIHYRCPCESIGGRHPCQVMIILGEASALVWSTMWHQLLPPARTTAIFILKL